MSVKDSKKKFIIKHNENLIEKYINYNMYTIF